ncbi:putative ATP-grasp-modified RiPP [Embleya sp. NPDC005971]|uniref:putative ATP-grasp-modified RiPP n=1 Tax=Embleya sp. NPDC005971 TaxID=3156724 RepID=UPI0033F4E6EF
MSNTTIPWALRLMSRPRPCAPAPYVRTELDAETQRVLYLDAAGLRVEMGRHGTSQDTSTASMSGGGDGSSPQRQSQDDSVTDHVPD